MDLPALIAQQLAARAATPRPDQPSVRARPPAKSGYVTRRIGGKWVLVPTGPRQDAALMPHIYVTPLRGR